MNIIAASFEKAKAEKRLALIGYLPAGYPNERSFVELARQAFRSGLDILEIGLPCANPYLDGDVIRAAVQQTLQQGLHARRALKLGGEALAGMGGAGLAMYYPESLDALGGDALLEACRQEQIAGILPVGMEIKTWQELARKAHAHQLDPIGFVTFGMEADTAALVAGLAEGFLYLQSQDGPTGGQGAFGDEVGERIAQVKAAVGRRLPLAVGFGVREGADVERIRNLGADGVIVGTALVEAASRGKQAVDDLISELAQSARFA